MPMLEQTAAHHYHHGSGHSHQVFYQEPSIHEPIPEKIQLTLILPNGVPSVLNVNSNTPMMDLHVQATSLNKLNPSRYSLVVLDSNQHVIHFKANQTVAQVVRNCHLPQINGSSTISLLPKETTHIHPTPKPKSQPFEITVRLQVNLPDAQKILLRVDPALPLHEIKEQICKQKKYSHSNEYTLRLPNKLDEPILLGLSLAEYKTKELTLVHLKHVENQMTSNIYQIQSYDRLYRARSESQPPKDSPREIIKESHKLLVNGEESCRSTTKARASTLRPSHTTLHAYWNDPNFDTQSQLSNSSSTNKKRPAPRAPGYISPTGYGSQTVYVHQRLSQLNDHSPTPPARSDHNQSQESLLSDHTKRKRKAPVLVRTGSDEKKNEIDSSAHPIKERSTLARPGLEPPPPPPSETKLPEAFTEKFNENSCSHTEVGPTVIESADSEHPLNPPSTQQSTSAPESGHDETSPTIITTELTIKNQSSETQTEPIFVAVDNETSEQRDTVNGDKLEKSPTVMELKRNVSPAPKPHRQQTTKEKKSSSVCGLLRIINDHNERGNAHQEKEKQQAESKEGISYFRVAKSRFGKFETENDGFVFNSVPIFDGSIQQKRSSPPIEVPPAAVPPPPPAHPPSHSKSTANSEQKSNKGKQAYDLLKKYQEEEQKGSNTMENSTVASRSETPYGPIQLEVTERTTHITVTVESDGKQRITRVSPVPQQLSPPNGVSKSAVKTVTEHRTVRRIGPNGEKITSTDTINRHSTSHESLMESIRQFGGSQNLSKK